MNFELPKNQSSIIKVIGVGGGGSNAVNHMFRQGIKGVDFIVCNTDQQALDASPVPCRITLGASLTEGCGAGSLPEVGRNAAIENIEELKTILSDNTKMLFITAGMGGGTGTGAAPIIAKAAKEQGILTVAIVTIPFGFEGKKRRCQADDGMDELKNNVDTLLVICNDKLREIYGNLSLTNAFAKADDILTTAARGIAEIITVTGNINVDFEDVRTVMTNSGVAIMGSAVATGEGRALNAVRDALESPLLNDNNIEGAKYILLNIGSSDVEVTMDEITEITEYIQDEAGKSADIIWGNCTDTTLADGLSVTIIATGFKTSKELGVEKVQNSRVVRKLDDETHQSKIEEIEQEPVRKTGQSYEEPELIRPAAEIKPEPVQTFEFDMGKPVLEDVSYSNSEEQEWKVTKVGNENSITSESERDFSFLKEENARKSIDRISRLKDMSLKFNAPGGITSLEKEPAYKRKQIRLENIPHSSDTSISRYTLNEDEEKKPEIRPNNSFLHDQVD